MGILFLHGADGYTDDAVIVEALRAGLDTQVHMPRLDVDGMSHGAWAARIAAELGPEVDTVIGHSFGGSTLLRMLTDADLGITRLVLLAAPDWGPSGWDVPDDALPEDAHRRLSAGLRIDLHHCLDDDVVPPGHVDLLAARLPRATVVRHARGGHQFAGDAIQSVAETLRRGGGPAPAS